MGQFGNSILARSISSEKLVSPYLPILSNIETCIRKKEHRVMRKALLTVLALLGSLLLTSCGRDVVVLSLQAPVNMIYDDDCDGDIDCVTTQPLIHHWIDSGYVKMWGMVSSAPTKLGAPTLKVFQQVLSTRKSFFYRRIATDLCAVQFCPVDHGCSESFQRR